MIYKVMSITSENSTSSPIARHMCFGAQELVLDTLHFCMWVDTEDALGANAMDVFTSLLGHLKPSVRTKAARDIGDLSAPLAGKNCAVEGDTVPRLVRLLTHAEPPSVRAAAAGALMTCAHHSCF